MQIPPSTKNNHPDKAIWYFLFFWTALNLLQSATLELHPDEAYYWVYSKFLDWGYFDHPPMVAVLIYIGDHIMHNELGLRLFTVITSTLSLYILWLIVKQYGVAAKWFIVTAGGIFIFHIYGFTTTPDVPLFFFTTLFYLIYQKYLKEDTLKWALLLGVIIACMLYSKYHGLLLIIFTVLSNIGLLKRRSFWLIVGLSVLLFIPHVLWQVNHQFPSLNYHLFERSAEHYHIETTLLYVPGQLVMAGILISVFLFYGAFTAKIKDSFIRCLMVNAIGIFVFFWLNTVKGEVQSHWTLIAFVPLVLLALISLKQKGQSPVWLFRLGVANIVLIVVIRLALIAPPDFIRNSSRFQSYYGYKQWAQQVKQHVGDAYVVMISGFQEPSKYCYYTNSLKGFAYDTRNYRRTQFDIWPIEDSMQHQRIYYTIDFPSKGLTNDSLKTARGKWYGTWVNDVQTYQKVDITTTQNKVKAGVSQKVVFDLTIRNPYNYPVSFKNTGWPHELVLGACFTRDDDYSYAMHTPDDFYQITLQPHQNIKYHFPVIAPPKKGHYELIFSIRTTPFPGGRNSRIINFTVE